MPPRYRSAHRRLGPLSGLLAALCLTACADLTSGHGTAISAGGGTSIGSPSTQVTPTAVPDTSSSESGTQGGPCNYPKSGIAARAVGVPPQVPQSASTLTLQVAVGSGKQPATITVALRAAKTPCTVNSIAFLATAKFYDHTTCHRLTTAGIFVLQCGDPGGTGSGGPGYTFDDELSHAETYPTGTVAMANAGPNTNGSQFFIIYRDSTTLLPSYPVFGTVSTGLDVVTQVAAGGSDDANAVGDGHPKVPVEIVTATAR